MAKQLKIPGAIKGVTVENNILLLMRRHCLECVSGNKEDVENCKARMDACKSKCLLWDYRQGPLTTAETNKRRLLYVINAYCKQCLVGDSVNDCTSDGRGGFKKCDFFELRNVVESD